MNRGLSRRLVASFVVLAITTVSVHLPVLGGSPGSLRGRVFTEDGVTPADGVVVRLADSRTDATYDSAPTATDGVFRIEQAPAGKYALLAKDDDQVFLASDAFDLIEGENDPVALSLKPGVQVAPAQSSGSSSSKKLPRWGEWLIAGAIIVTGLYLINEVTKEEDREQPASPF